jgi:multimeric flavodoxin WrbA
MKALIISGSPRRDGNTESLCNRCAEGLEAEGISTEVVSVSGLSLHGCTGCGYCRQLPDDVCECVINDDVAALIPKFAEADIIVVGSPVYFGSATPEIMALLDRVGYVLRPRGLLSRKVGAAIAVARRAGKTFTFAQLSMWFLINDMVVPGSSYWNVAQGRDRGDALEDEEGVGTIDRLAANLAWAAKGLRGG